MLLFYFSYILVRSFLIVNILSISSVIDLSIAILLISNLTMLSAIYATPMHYRLLDM